MSRTTFFVLFFSILGPLLSAQANAQGAINDSWIVIRELVIEGTRSLDNEKLREITNSLTETRSREDAEEVGDRIRNAFQKRGYFDVEVAHVKLKALDPLALPKPARVVAEVDEGPLYQLGEVAFAGNRAMNDAQLKSAVSLRLGEDFDVSRVRGAIENLMKLYRSSGYLDFMPVPETSKLQEGKMRLIFNVNEGPQYKMGTLDFRGKKELVEQLELQWELRPGDPFDADYLYKYIEKVRPQLTADFKADDAVLVVRNCPEQTVIVFMNLDNTRPAMDMPRSKQCDFNKNANK